MIVNIIMLKFAFSWADSSYEPQTNNRWMHLRLKMFLETNKKGDEVIQLFVDKFPQIPAPSRQGINKLNNRFEETGTVHDLPKRGKFLSSICMSGSEVVVEQIGPQDRAI